MTVDIPARFPVAINGRPYQLQLGPDYQRGAPSSQRATVDNSQEPSGASIDTGIAWRRSQSDWTGGAGQEHFDEAGPESKSNRTRFWRSVNVDPWARRQLGMLSACITVDTSYAFTSPSMVALPDLGTYGHVYVGGTTNDNNSIRRLVMNGASAPTVATVTGANYGSTFALATNGTAVFAACNIGLYSISGTTATVITTGGHEFVTVCNGRLLASPGGGALKEYSVTGTPGTTFAGAPAATIWKAACGVPKAILVAGYVGRTSTIYRISYDETSGGLNVALTPATDSFQGETILCLAYYQGFVLIGSSKGLRVGTVDESGNLTTGPIITAPLAVHSICPEGQYVWFTWQVASDATEGLISPFGVPSSVTGIENPAGTGRLDLSNFVLPLQPAYATDVCDTAGVLSKTDNVTAVARVNGVTLFAGDDTHVFYSDTASAATAGWIESSLVEYGFEGEKIATDVEIRHSDGDGLITVTIITEDGDETFLGTLGTAGGFQSLAPIPAQHVQAEASRLRFDFSAIAAGNLLGGDTPLSWWKMQEPSGTTATDTQALHNGTYSGATVNGTGPGTNLDKSVQFDTTDTMIVGDYTSYEQAGAFSMEVWVNFAGANSDDAGVLTIGKWEPVAVGSRSWYIGCGSTASTFQAWSWFQTGNSGSGFSEAAFVEDVGLAAGWHHVAIVFTPLTSLKLYVDGALVATDLGPIPTFTTASAGSFKIGGSDAAGTPASLSRAWDVAGLAFYNYALSDVSVAAHYAAVDDATFDAFLRRWALRAVPVVRTYEVIQAPLIFSETIKAGSDNGEDYPFDTYAEYQYLLALKNSREVFSYDELGHTVNAVMDEVTLGNITRINEKDGVRHHFDGELLVKLWTV